MCALDSFRYLCPFATLSLLICMFFFRNCCVMRHCTCTCLFISLLDDDMLLYSYICKVKTFSVFVCVWVNMLMCTLIFALTRSRATVVCLYQRLPVYYPSFVLARARLCVYCTCGSRRLPRCCFCHVVLTCLCAFSALACVPTILTCSVFGIAHAHT